MAKLFVGFAIGTNMTVHAGTTKGVFIGNTDTRGNLIPVTP